MNDYAQFDVIMDVDAVNEKLGKLEDELVDLLYTMEQLGVADDIINKVREAKQHLTKATDTLFYMSLLPSYRKALEND